MVIAFICKMLVIFNGQRRKPGSRPGNDFVRPGRQERVIRTLRVGHRQRLWGEVTGPVGLTRRLAGPRSCLGNWPLGFPGFHPRCKAFWLLFFLYFLIAEWGSNPRVCWRRGVLPASPLLPRRELRPAERLRPPHPSLGSLQPAV